ncbi:MAG: Ig-like domain-containing protein, partial [Sulfurimonadaceae bacterium]
FKGAMMKHLLILLLLVTGSISLYGSSDDLTTSKGTDQEVIVLLSPSVAQTDVWNNAKIEVSFSVPLDASSVQKNNIKLTHLSSKTNDHMAGTIEYDKFDNKVIFTPSALLSEGIYEVEIKSLKADKAYKTIQINEIKYRFNVPEVINGHQLPPEPDQAVNDSTLLGIDANNNGVRDDVERWIYKTYEHPIERGIFMQSARAYQKVIVDPSKAHETTKYIDDSYSCTIYMLNTNPSLHTKYDYVYPTTELKKIQFNTMQRHIAYKRYNAQFNGEVLSAPPASKEACLFDENGRLIP